VTNRILADDALRALQLQQAQVAETSLARTREIDLHIDFNRDGTLG
jgi:hypothetical protein